jgi:hypothetical protein
MLRENIQVLGDCNVQRNTRRRPTIILRRAAPIFFWGDTAVGDGDPASNSAQLVASPVTGRGSPDRRLSSEAARYVERIALLRNVITRVPAPLVATMLLVSAFLRSRKCLASGQKHMAKLAASTNAQAFGPSRFSLQET